MEQLYSSCSPPLLHAILERVLPAWITPPLFPPRAKGLYLQLLPRSHQLQNLWCSPGGFSEPAPSALEDHLTLLVHFILVTAYRGNSAGSCRLSFPPGCAPTCWATGLASSSTSLRLFGCRFQGAVVVFSTQHRGVFEDWGMSPGIGIVGLNPPPAEEREEWSSPTFWVSALRTRLHWKEKKSKISAMLC